MGCQVYDKATRIYPESTVLGGVVALQSSPGVGWTMADMASDILGGRLV